MKRLRRRRIRLPGRQLDCGELPYVFIRLRHVHVLHPGLVLDRICRVPYGEPTWEALTPGDCEQACQIEDPT